MKTKNYERQAGSLYHYPTGEEIFVPWAKKDDENKKSVQVELISIGKCKLYATKNLVKMELSMPRCPFAHIPGKFIRLSQLLISELIKNKVARKLYEVSESIDDIQEDTKDEAAPTKDEAEEYDPETERFG